MRVIEQYLTRNGIKPFDDINHNYEQLYLCFAGAFGITMDDHIHRKAIYNYIQTHHSSIGESSLQGTLGNSVNWNSGKRAHYYINQKGWQMLNDEYVPNDEKILFFPIVLFKTYLENNLIEVKSYPDKRPYELFLNSEKVEVDVIYNFLHRHGIDLSPSGTSKPREVHSWLLKRDYAWEIVNYDEIINYHAENDFKQFE